jgi:ferredoxin-NADP reductase
MNQIKMRVVKRRDLTPGIAEFTLVPVEQLDLPEFAPGAHITVETPSGAMRRYSLVNDGSIRVDQAVFGVHVRSALTSALAISISLRNEAG